MPSDPLDGVIKSTISQLWMLLKAHWPSMWPYALVFLIFVLGGMVIQILMLRGGGHNHLSPGFNRMVGSLFYGIFFWLQVVIAYLIFGSQVIDDLWFTIFGIIAYPAVKWFLKAVGFWYY